MFQESQTGASNVEEYKERIKKMGSDFELGLFLHILRKNLIWILLFLSIAGVGGYFYLRYAQPVYEASATLQILTENSSMFPSNKFRNVLSN